MLRKKLLLLISAIALVSGLTFQISQAADFCTRPGYCRDQALNCRWRCGGLSGNALQKCWAACDHAYDRCCSSY